jgi:hypothetical protein
VFYFSRRRRRRRGFFKRLLVAARKVELGAAGSFVIEATRKRAGESPRPRLSRESRLRLKQCSATDRRLGSPWKLPALIRIACRRS